MADVHKVTLRLALDPALLDEQRAALTRAMSVLSMVADLQEDGSIGHTGERSARMRDDALLLDGVATLLGHIARQATDADLRPHNPPDPAVLAAHALTEAAVQVAHRANDLVAEGGGYPRICVDRELWTELVTAIRAWRGAGESFLSAVAEPPPVVHGPDCPTCHGAGTIRVHDERRPCPDGWHENDPTRP